MLDLDRLKRIHYEVGPIQVIYAGKAHPQLRAADGSIPMTFADNSFTFQDLFEPARADTLYWPHVAHLRLSRSP